MSEYWLQKKVETKIKVISGKVRGFAKVLKNKGKSKKLCEITTYSPVSNCMGW